MNEGIYDFRRYEDNSLEYTGIRKHSRNEDVGLFNTVITKETYDKLAMQQSESMEVTDLNSDVFSLDDSQQSFSDSAELAKNKQDSKDVDKKNDNKNAHHRFDKRSVSLGATVLHKKFGTGKVIHITADKIIVQFAGEGEKTFSFPSAFINGFLELKN